MAWVFPGTAVDAVECNVLAIAALRSTRDVSPRLAFGAADFQVDQLGCIRDAEQIWNAFLPAIERTTGDPNVPMRGILEHKAAATILRVGGVIRRIDFVDASGGKTRSAAHLTLAGAAGLQPGVAQRGHNHRR